MKEGPKGECATEGYQNINNLIMKSQKVRDYQE